MKDILEIIQVIMAFGIHADAHRWNDLEALFTPTVEADYSALTGAASAPTTAAQLVGSWKAFLPGFSGTHHHIGTPLIDVTGDQASAEAEFTATHVINDDALAGRDTWTLGGRYMMRLRKRDEQWKIEHVTLIPVWQSGNLALPQEAGKRVSMRM
jgi:hypothetical protein